MDNSSTPTTTPYLPQPTPNQPVPPTTPLPKTKLGRSWQLVKHSWSVMTHNGSFIRLQIIGALMGFLLMLSFGLIAFAAMMGIFFATGGTAIVNSEDSTSLVVELLTLGLTALFIFTTVTVTNYISVAMSYGALRVFGGNPITAKECLRAANLRLKSILSFSFITASVGFLLDQLGKRVPFIASIAVRLVGAAWNIATMFAIPLIASRTEPVSGLTAVRESATTLRQIWGESLISKVSVGVIGAIILVLTITGGLFFSFTFAAALNVSPIWPVIITILVNIGLIAIFSILAVIVQTALFYYAKTGQAPAYFSAEILNTIIEPKK